MALLVVDHVRHVRHGRDDVHVELAVQTFLDNLHVQKTEEAATETEAESHRRLGLERERRIVEL